jgi:hypothetical protein
MFRRIYSQTPSGAPLQFLVPQNIFPDAPAGRLYSSWFRRIYFQTPSGAPLRFLVPQNIFPDAPAGRLYSSWFRILTPDSCILNTYVKETS